MRVRHNVHTRHLTCISSLSSVAPKVGKMLPADSSIKFRVPTIVDVALERELMRVAMAEYCRSLLLIWRVVQVEDTDGDTPASMKPAEKVPLVPPVMFVLLPPVAQDDVPSPLLSIVQLLPPAL